MAKRQRTATVECDICHRRFKPQGYARHRQTCERKRDRGLPTGKQTKIDFAAAVRTAEENERREKEAETARVADTGTQPHIIVKARAGTGKTFTLIEALNILKGCKTRGIVPSPQQKAVWDAVTAGPAPRYVCFCAFNRTIAEELKRKVPRGVKAQTLHAYGFAMCTRNLGGKRIRVSDWKTANIIEDITGIDSREYRKEQAVAYQATKALVEKCKLNLVEPTEENLDELRHHFLIDLNGQREQVYKLVPEVLERSKDMESCNYVIDYADMIWLPVVLNLPLFINDLLLVDEAQDMNRCQQELARRATKRLVLCGDPKQSIYGFAGADTESMPRMLERLQGEDRGCLELPLTVTRRCGKTIVEAAKKIVPDFEAFDSNPLGEISESTLSKYRTEAPDGSMVLCRVNAPLIRECFRFLKEGRKANIQGREIGDELVAMIERLKAEDVTDLVAKISDWEHQEVVRENKKREPDERRLEAISDKASCITLFCEGKDTVEEVTAAISEVFTDEATSGIKLSSVHRAKGLEAKTVYIITHEAPIPHPMAKNAWQQEQEMNLKYVAITRAIDRLVWVRSK